MRGKKQQDTTGQRAAEHTSFETDERERDSGRKGGRERVMGG